jgi:hypothetical protein
MGTKKYAPIRLHYSRIKKFVHSYYDACPREKMKANDYMTAVSEGYMNGKLRAVLPPKGEEEE